MFRSALLLPVLVALAAPAAASSYSAKLVTPGQTHIVARDINWACAGSSCQGSTQESRPEVLCQALAKRAGKVESFHVDGRPFSEAELAKCNTSVKTGTVSTAAAQ